MKTVTLESINLKNNQTLNEKWLQAQIAENPAILGLGELHLRTREKIVSSGGRLDLLLEDADSDSPTRYECEIQLGDTDESHIIRTIEYWDLERKRYPQYDHVAVLVAEGVTSRFLNVLSLFNGQIPLIVLKLEAFKVGNDIALHFTKIFDKVQLGLPDETEVAEPVNRAYWEKKSTAPFLKLADELISIVKEVEPSVESNYNKHYIGLTKNDVAVNFCIFKVRKSFVMMRFHVERDDEMIQELESVGLDVEYNNKWNNLQIKFSKYPSETQKPLIVDLIEQAKKRRGL
ncbi:MAG: hypothetical protein J6V38_01580 [Kiritimatiellae bacterium]|jgi:hypothetical protein|nr:hypothetical protein [Kiritimatiellia bacterium]